jgi:arylformamidase
LKFLSLIILENSKKTNQMHSLKFIVLVTLFCFVSCASKKTKDISYALKLTEKELKEAKLNIFVSKKVSEKMPVLIFVHGGNWNTGNKNTYGFFGRNFAKKGIITIIPDYTLSPKTDYNGMTKQIAEAINWAKKNVSEYGGDPNQIFLTGHSAGGHLIALAVMNPKYGINPETISGIILNDAAGLDMKNYLENNPPTSENDYLATWSDNPENWRDASPIYYLNSKTPPLLIYVGNKTYSSIKIANDRFLAALTPLQPDAKSIFVNKKHVPMILQYFFSGSSRYDEIIDFIGKNKQ